MTLLPAYSPSDLLDVPEDPLQYADLSAWWHELLESGETESGRTYWQNRVLSDLAPGRLPFEKRRCNRNRLQFSG